MAAPNFLQRIKPLLDKIREFINKISFKCKQKFQSNGTAWVKPEALKNFWDIVYATKSAMSNTYSDNSDKLEQIREMMTDLKSTKDSSTDLKQVPMSSLLKGINDLQQKINQIQSAANAIQENDPNAENKRKYCQNCISIVNVSIQAASFIIATSKVTNPKHKNAPAVAAAGAESFIGFCDGMLDYAYA